MLPPAAAKALATGNAAIRANAHAPSTCRGAIACLLLLDVVSLTRTTAAVEHRPAADCDIVMHSYFQSDPYPGFPRPPQHTIASSRQGETPCPHTPAKSCATTSKKSSRGTRWSPP